MEGFTLIDGGALFVLAISALLAYSRGIMREALSIGGWIIAAVTAFVFANEVEPLVREIPLVGDAIRDQCELGILIAFGIVFVVALIVVSIFTPLISGAVRNSALGPLDQGLGFFFGLIRGAILIIVALIVYERLVAGGEGIVMVETSKTIELLAQTKDRVAEMVPETMPEWVAGRYAQLTGPCGEAAPATGP